jgi:multiple sugar transport system ATP-binding protein
VLNEGRLQQLGTPMRLDQWPSNVFVAQFIDSPAMNLLPVLVVGGGQMQMGSKQFLVEEPLAAAPAERSGEELTSCLRPEQLTLVPVTNRKLAAEAAASRPSATSS